MDPEGENWITVLIYIHGFDYLIFSTSLYNYTKTKNEISYKISHNNIDTQYRSINA